MSGQVSITEIFLASDWISKSIVLILILMSIWSWSIVFAKLKAYRDAKKKNKIFEEILLSNPTLEQILISTKRISDNIAIKLLHAGMSEIGSRDNRSITEYAKQSAKERAFNSMYSVKSLYLDQLENGLNYIATIGSNAPFVGLLGMVWSVLNSFHKMSLVKQATISSMAPSLVEAVMVTAIGLVVSISSMISYEVLVRKLEQITLGLDNIYAELTNIISRELEK